MVFKRKVSLGLVFLGVLLISFDAFSITGFAISKEGLFSRAWSVIGIGLIVVGISVSMLDRMTSTLPKNLYIYVPNECLSEGIIPGGYDPSEQVVPAFDPKKFTPKQIREAFDIGSERSLVEIVGSSKEKFFPRFTGPENKKIGIYGCESYVPASDISVVGQDDYFT